MVVLRDGYQDKVSEIDIQNFCMTFVEKGQIPKYGVPSKIILNAEIPTTSAGKISKKDIRAEFNGPIFCPGTGPGYLFHWPCRYPVP